VAALTLALFVGWRVPVPALTEGTGLGPRWLFGLWVWCLRLVAPLAIFTILVANL